MARDASVQVSGKIYQFVREIGRGSFGDVYLVRDSDGREFALKVLHIRPTPGQIASFTDEFRFLTYLKHPYLCAAYDFAHSEDLKNYLFISDYVPGESFFEATEGKSPNEIEELAVQVFEVLDYLHLHEVIHFDIKCPNIIVQPDGTVRLLDFGLAHLQIHPLTTFPGSYRYAAPEVLQRSHETDHRADLYSFGMVLYRALTRGFPFPEDDPPAIIEWQMHQSLSWTAKQCEEIPIHLRKLTEFLLKRNPIERLSRGRYAINWINLHTDDRYRLDLTRQRMTLPREGPLVARDKEIAKALETLDACSGGALVCVGEQGIGKSRLLKEIKCVTEVKGFQCLWLENLSEKDGLFQLTQQLDLSDVHTPDEFYRQSTARIRDMGPLVLFIDDLHQADPLFLEWVSKIYQERLLAALFVGWEGAVPSRGPLVPLFQGATTAFLAPFTREDLKTYVRETLSDSEAGNDWLDSIYDFSSGLPFLASEGLRYLLENPGSRRLPTSIENLYANSLLPLSGAAIDILETLSLWKRAASLEEISRTVSLEISKVTPLMPHLLTTGLVARIASFDDLAIRYRIPNAALALFLRGRQAPSQSEERSKRILTCLEEEGKSSLEELASCASHTGDAVKARHYLLKLGEEYEASFHTQKAIEAYQEILHRFGDDPHDSEKIRKKLIPLLVLAGHPDEAEALFPEDARLSAADRKLKGWVLTRSGRFGEAKALYQQGLLESTEDDPLHREIMNDLANIHVQTNEGEKAIRIFRQTLPTDSMNDQEKLKVLKNNNLGLALALVGKMAEGSKFEREKLSLFRKAGDEHHVAAILSQLGFIELRGQNLSQAALAFEESLSLSEELGDLHNIFVLLDNLILICQKRGHYSEAIRYFSKSVSYRNLLPPSYQTVQNYLKGAFLYLTIGLVEPAHVYLKKIESLIEHAGSRSLRGWISLAWGYYLREKKSPDASVGRLKEAIGIGEQEKDQGLLLWGHYALADLWLEQNQFEKAREIYTKASEKWEGLRDEELQLRFKLLGLCLDPITPAQRDALRRLGRECEEKGMLELAAEAFTAARDPKGQEIYRQIAAHLPEEYRMAYQAAPNRLMRKY